MKNKVLSVLFVGLAATGLVACGGGGEESATPADPAAAAGQKLATASCLGCHSTDGSRRTGPTFKGLYGSQVTLEGGTTVTADDAHLVRAVQDPDADIRQGFRAGVMSNVVRKGQFSDEEANQIVAYLKTVK